MSPSEFGFEHSVLLLGFDFIHEIETAIVPQKSLGFISHDGRGNAIEVDFTNLGLFANFVALIMMFLLSAWPSTGYSSHSWSYSQP